LKIAIILTRIDQLGPVKVIQTLVNTLYKFENIIIDVFYFDKKVDSNIKILVPVLLLDSKHFCFNEYDIIHTSGIRPDFFAFINRRKIKCHISTIHNFVFDDLRFNYNRLISLIFGNIWLMLWKKADKLVCVSGELKNYYGNWFSSIKLAVIHNGISDPENSKTPDSDVLQTINNFKSRGLKVLGVAGILTKRKGVDQLFPLLSGEKSYALIIIGSGKELPNLKKIVKKMGISDRVEFCGFRSNAAVYFRYFDFYVMPSRSEGFCLALMEAVRQKVPVMCSELPVFKELFNSDEVTFFKLEDITSLTQALRTSMELGKKKVSLAYARYQSQYTDRIMAQKYYDLYSALCPVL
jgi:glycosyltransferase involved in cell wall biosynthesis